MRPLVHCRSTYEGCTRIGRFSQIAQSGFCAFCMIFRRSISHTHEHILTIFMEPSTSKTTVQKVSTVRTMCGSRWHSVSHWTLPPLAHCILLLSGPGTPGGVESAQINPQSCPPHLFGMSKIALLKMSLGQLRRTRCASCFNLLTFLKA